MSLIRDASLAPSREPDEAAARRRLRAAHVSIGAHTDEQAAYPGI